MKRMKTSDVTRQVFDSASGDVREMAKQRGFVTRLIKQLEAVTGKQWHRQHVEMWLNSDEEKRTEPRFGAGLLMLSEARKLNERMKHERSSVADS